MEEVQHRVKIEHVTRGVSDLLRHEQASEDASQKEGEHAHLVVEID